MSNNVVVICLDTVRKDVYDDHAPSLTRMADANYEECRAASCWSTPSHASMLSGMLPHQHGISTYQRDFTALSRENTVLSSLEQYHTAGVSANEFAGPSFGFDYLFDDFSSVSPRKRYAQGIDPIEFTQDTRSFLGDSLSFLRAALGENHRLQSLCNGGVGAIKTFAPRVGIVDPFDAGAQPALRYARRYLTNGEAPAFVFVNLMDAHLPLSRHRGMDGVEDIPASWSTIPWNLWDLMGERSGYEEYWEMRRRLYTAAVRYLDRLVSTFVKRVQAETDRETVAIVTADHGENLGRAEEDYFVDHTSSLSEGLLHVPLSVITEGETTMETATERYVSHRHLPDIIRGAAEGHIPDVSADTAVAEVLGKGPTPEPPENEAFWDRTIRCAYEGNKKTVWDSLDTCTTYQLAPGRPCWQEVCDDESTPPGWTEDVFETGIGEIDASRASADVASGTRQRLEELGYL